MFGGEVGLGVVEELNLGREGFLYGTYGLFAGFNIEHGGYGFIINCRVAYVANKHILGRR